MMNKKYLMNGFAALALVAGISSCTKDVTAVSQSEIEAAAKENAEQALGITIPDNQDWTMASQANAAITVNGNYGENYTVTIYENNPFADATAVVLGKVDVTAGETARFTFTCPNALRSAFAAIKDEKGYSYVKPVVINNNTVVTSFGGDDAPSSARRGAAKRGAADDFVTPTYEKPDFSAYIDDAVAITAENNTTDPANTVRHYVIPAGTTWSENIPLIQASDPDDNSIVSVYVLGTLNVNEKQSINGGYGGAYKLIVGDGGVVNIAEGVTLFSNANQNSGNVGEIHVLAGGQIKGAGKLEFSNGTNSYNYNAGTIEVGTLNNNGGTLYNVGSMKADVLQGGSGASTYINAGKVEVGKAEYGSTTANMRIMNNCWWEVTGKFACRNIVQGEGAYFHAQELAMSGSEDGSSLKVAGILAKGNSLIDIEGAVAFNGVDIIGPTGDDYAYLQFGSVGLDYCAMNYADSWDGGHHISVGAIQNNIRLSVDNANTTYNKYNNRNNPYQALLDLLNGEMACTYNYDVETNGQWADTQLWPTQGNGNATLVQKGQYDIAVVEESECSPGIKPKDPDPIKEAPKVYTYAFEDQLGGDYDMNDVVLKVSYHVAEKNSKGEITKIDSTKLDCSLVAAGAEFNIKIKIGDDYLFGGDEIHDALGVNKKVMVNTGGENVTNGTVQNGVTPKTENGVAAPADWDGNFTHLKVSIEVLTTNATYTYPNEDIYPHAIMVPTDWAWPTERTRVSTAYFHKDENGKIYKSFAWWAQEYPHPAIAEDWYDYPTGAVMTND